MTVAIFLIVLGSTSLLAVAGRWLRPSKDLPALESWALADRRFGPMITWFLLGGTIYTAYTFTAVPGVVYGAGAIGFFALPYTIIVYPLAFLLLPRLWTVASQHGYLTVGDFVRGRYGSPVLALAVAVTGILATMPYLALQLLGIRAVLTTGGLYPSGVLGDAALVGVFAVLAVATYRQGLRAPTVIAFAKAAAVFGAVLAVVPLVLVHLGGAEGLFEPRPDGPAVPLTLDPALYPAFATLALGSAMALLMYPHVLTAAFAASSADALRRAIIGLPAWSAVLGMFGLLGIAALAAGVSAPQGNAEVAVPLLVRSLMPAAVTGLVLGALTVAALVPASVMSIAAATSFVRNIYVEYFHPTATPKHQLRIARVVSISAKFGAVAFVFGLRDQAAINLQLLGGVWILQTFPAVAIGLYTSWLHHRALLVGWGLGMVSGTLMVVWDGFSAVVSFEAAGHRLQMYAALAALVLNLTAAATLTPLLDRLGWPRLRDQTGLSTRIRSAPRLEAGPA